MVLDFQQGTEAHSLEVPSKDLGFSLRATGDSKSRKSKKNLGIQRTAINEHGCILRKCGRK